MTGDPTARAQTLRALHAVAETVLAGHQYRVAGTIRLAVTPDGFTTTRALPGRPVRLTVRGTDLLADTTALPLRGRLGDLATAAGVSFGGPEGVYPLSAFGENEPVIVDAPSAAELAGAWSLGDAALRRLLTDADVADEPVLWPEHLDVAVTIDSVNYGVSPGDGFLAQPYAYVGPHEQRRGDFWDAPFGAAHPLAGWTESDVLDWPRKGRQHAARDPRV